MRRRIRKDYQRFKRVVKGKVRENLRDLVSKGYFTGRKGAKTVKVPTWDIEIPEFRYDPKSAGGIGAGEGELGDPVAGDQPGPELSPGSGPGAHYPEVEIDLEEFARILGEELHLPRMRPKGEEVKTEAGQAYEDTSRTGPEPLLRKKRSFKRGLIRKALLNSGDQPNPDEVFPLPPKTWHDLIPIKEDKEYLYPGQEEKREARAVVIFMRDVSGSMTGNKTDIIRQENYLIDVWLQANFEDVKRVYLVHDYHAEEVDEETFYQLSTSGGTRISSVYDLCSKVINKRFPPESWNIYPFHFSDGENLSDDTTKACLPLLKDAILPEVSLFCYGQVSPGRPRPRNHLKLLASKFQDDERFAASLIPDRGSILDSITDFLGRE